MNDQIPEYEGSNLNKIKDIISSGEVPSEITLEEAKELYYEIQNEGRSLIETTKNLNETLNELLNSMSVDIQSTSIQVSAFMKTLELMDTISKQEDSQSD